MKKIVNNQSGMTLVELLLAAVILGFIVSGFVLLSGSIFKTNTDSNKASQAMAFATVISELIKDEYQNNSSSITNGSTVTLTSTVIDKNSAPNLNPNDSISQAINIPKQDASTGFEDIIYISGAQTGYQYNITNKLKSNRYFEIMVTVKNTKSGEVKTIIFRNNYDNS